MKGYWLVIWCLLIYSKNFQRSRLGSFIRLVTTSYTELAISYLGVKKRRVAHLSYRRIGFSVWVGTALALARYTSTWVPSCEYPLFVSTASEPIDPDSHLINVRVSGDILFPFFVLCLLYDARPTAASWRCILAKAPENDSILLTLHIDNICTITREVWEEIGAFLSWQGCSNEIFRGRWRVLRDFPLAGFSEAGQFLEETLWCALSYSNTGYNRLVWLVLLPRSSTYQSP